MSVAADRDPDALRRLRDELLEELARAADGLEILGEGAPRGVRDRWIRSAVRYAAERQSAVDRLAGIDVALGGEPPAAGSRAALERILEADSIVLAEAGRLMAQIQTQIDEGRQAGRAAMSYIDQGQPPPPMLRRAF
jgi:hypothetical protein